jgi:hypothetical protein
MVYQGHIEDGRVVLDEAPLLPNGIKVEVKLLDENPKVERPWLKHLGCVKDFPANASQTVDEVLYGRPEE